MARIRTIKPEFWTDEVVVKLPFEARLLFIGLWNFSDDYGCIKDEPGRIQLQIFPGDASLDVFALLDLLVSSGLVERIEGQDGELFLAMRSWEKHQKVDNPSKIRVLTGSRESYRKVSIPASARRAVALKYGCKPGHSIDAQCYFCGSPGSIWWPTTTNGRAGSWVAFSELELDHFVPEKSGGIGDCENLVLSCRCCNRSRRDGTAHQFILKKNDARIDEDLGGNRDGSRALDSPREPSRALAPEGKGKEGKGKEKAFTDPAAAAAIPSRDAAAASEPEKPVSVADYVAEVKPIDAVTGRAIELTAMLRKRGASLQASDPRVRAWAADGVSDAAALTALETAQQRRADRGTAQPINAGLLDAILNDANPARAGPGKASAKGAEMVRFLTGGHRNGAAAEA